MTQGNIQHALLVVRDNSGREQLVYNTLMASNWLCLELATRNIITSIESENSLIATSLNEPT